MIGYAFCGSFCTISDSLKELGALVGRGLDVVPIMSERVYETNTRFFAADELRRRVKLITGREIIHTVEGAEPFGPKPLDALIIAPCTGNTLAKMAMGITDTAVTMAAKAHLRADGRILIALASNDAMSQNLKNLGGLITRRSIFFVPMRQDNPTAKPHSLVADMSRICEAYDAMCEGVQLRPLFV
jgi:dipicolinate synthase subunit B